MQGLNFSAVLDEPGHAGGEIVDAEYETVKTELMPEEKWSLAVVKPQLLQYVTELDKMVGDAKAIAIKGDSDQQFAVALGGKAKELAKKLLAKETEVTAEAQEYIDAVHGMVTLWTEKLIIIKRTVKGQPVVSNPDCIEAVLKKKILDYQSAVELKRRQEEAAARKAQADMQAELDRIAREANEKALAEARAKAEAEAAAQRERDEAEAKERRAREEEEARKRKASEAEMEDMRKRQDEDRRALARKAEEDRQIALQRAAEEAAARAIVAPTIPEPIVPQTATTVHTETGASAYSEKRWTVEILPGQEDMVPRAYCSPDLKKIREAVKGGVRTVPGVRIAEDTGIKFKS